MAINASDLTEYTFAQIKTAAKHSMVQSLGGSASYTINGRTIGRVTMKEAREIYEWADTMEQLDNSANNGGIALVEFGPEQ